MSQRVIESIRNLSLNVFCVGWHLAITANHSSKCALCELAAVLHVNKSNAAGNSKKLYTPDLWHRFPSFFEAGTIFIKIK